MQADSVQANSEAATGERVSVILTVLNDAPGVLGTLEALVGQSRLPDEIVVVDGGSTDGTHEALLAFDSAGVPLRVLRRDGANIAEGRNHGIAAARHGIIACTDSGCVPDANWLEELLRPFADPDVGVVGGAYSVAARTRLERVVGLLTMPGQLRDVEPARFNPSARSVAFRAGAWKRAGGFPEWLYTAEDTLFDCRLRENGEVFTFARSAIVRWRPRSSFKAVWKQFREYSRGEARIGRGAETAAVLWRRYALSAFGCLATIACVLFQTGFTLPVIAVLMTALLLTSPFHRTAMAIAGRTYCWTDYPVSVLAGHWIALASLCGHMLGRRDRRERPQVYVGRLRTYWGEDSVGDVPPWRMKSALVPRTLIVSWHWPPAARACTQVLANLFQAAPTGSFQVLTRRLPESAISDSVPPPHLRTTGVRWPMTNDEVVRVRTWLASIRTVVGMVRAAKRIHRDWPVQRVIAVYPHRYGMLSGWLIARALGVPLAAYMHDLFAETLVTGSRVKAIFWKRIDRAALGSARLVLVPTEEFVAHYVNRGIRTCRVLPHCLAGDVKPSAPPPAGDTLRLLYAGNVYQAHEDAVAALVRGIDRLDGVALAFLSRPNRALADQACEWVDRAEAIRRMRETDVLVVALGRETPYPAEIRCCFPSKIVDYLAVGRPLLAVVPEGCFVERLVRQTGCGVCVTAFTDDAIERAIGLLRDPACRAKMAEAAAGLADQLRPERWMAALCRLLAYGPREGDETPEFPPPAGDGRSLCDETSCTAEELLCR